MLSASLLMRALMSSACLAAGMLAYSCFAAQVSCSGLRPSSGMTDSLLQEGASCLLRRSWPPHMMMTKVHHAGKGQPVTLVQTNIEDGAELSAWDPVVMTEARRVHNAIMRAQLRRFHGYALLPASAEMLCLHCLQAANKLTIMGMWRLLAYGAPLTLHVPASILLGAHARMHPTIHSLKPWQYMQV